MYKSGWKDLFTYTKGERRGIFLLSAIIILILIYNILGPFSIMEERDFANFKNNIAKYEARLDSIKEYKTVALKSKKSKKKVLSKSNMHYFDPNSISKSEWLEFGVKEYQAKSIMKYIRKGGSFSNPDDLRKMYCLSKSECSILIPFVKIKSEEVCSLDDDFEIMSFTPKQYNFELNTVSFDSLLEIHGIGPSTAKAIIKYRDILGGYYNIEQLKEVYNIDSAKYLSISTSFYVDASLMDTLKNINTATYYSLKRHPYINKAMAYKIVEYRNQNGKYTDLEQMKNIDAINDSIYNRIYRYFAPLK